MEPWPYTPALFGQEKKRQLQPFQFYIHTGVVMQGASICVAILVTILLIIDGAVALYACLIWPRKEETAAGTTVSEPLFVVGIVTFVICFTLPFVLITGFLCCVTSCQPVDPTKNRSSFGTECFTNCKLRKSTEDNAT